MSIASLLALLAVWGDASPGPDFVSVVVYDPKAFLFDHTVEVALSERPEHYDWAYGQGREATLTRSQFHGVEKTAVALCARLRVSLEVPQDEDCRAYSDQGRLVASYATLVNGGNLWVVPTGRQFLWPSVAIGHRQPVGGLRVVAEGPVELETLAHEPKLFRLHNFITQAEVDGLVSSLDDIELEQSTSGLQMRDSKSSKNKGITTGRRTSTNAWDSDSDLAMTIKRRAFDMLQFDEFEPGWCDGLQMVHYDPGQYYHLHQDWFDPVSLPQSTYNWDPSNGGANRFATLFIYLSDTDLGGETVFPSAVKPTNWTSDSRGTDEEIKALAAELFDESTQDLQLEMVDTCRQKLAVVPRKGDAVLWYHQDVLGHLDLKALHGACPPLRGDKWGANLWIWNGPLWTMDDLVEPHPDARTAEFKNLFDRTLELKWINDQGEFIAIGEIEPGKRYTSNTYKNHRFAAIIDGQMVSSWTILEEDAQEFLITTELNEHAALWSAPQHDEL